MNKDKNIFSLFTDVFRPLTNFIEGNASVLINWFSSKKKLEKQSFFEIIE